MSNYLYLAGAAAYVFFCLVVFWFLATRTMPNEQPKHHKAKTYITACSGCGFLWKSYEPDITPITRCPNCQMSNEQFEELKRTVKDQLDANREAKAAE